MNAQRYNQIEEFYTSPANGNGRRSTTDDGSTPATGFWQRLRRWLKERLPSKKQLLFLPQVLSPRERYIIALLVVVFLVGVVWLPFGWYYHGTVAAADFGGSYTEGLIGQPQFLNPLLAQNSDTDRDLTELIYAGLMKYDGNGNLIPDLAANYEISPDGLEYTFTLRDNLKWQDGMPLTTDDVIFTVRILQTNEYNGSQRINWNGIDIEKLSDQKLKFRLKTKYAQFMNNATLGIMPKHLWENIGATNFTKTDLNLKPIGAGAYQFKRLRKDNNGKIISYELSASPNYYSGRPFIDSLIFNFYDNEEELIGAYNSNAIDGLGLISAENFKRLNFTGKLAPQAIKLPRYFAAFFNQAQSNILADKNVRLALNYGTDKQAIVDQVLAGQGITINSPLLKELRGAVSPKYGYDQNFASQILENSGWKKGEDGWRSKNGTTLTVKVKTSAWPELAQTAQLLKTQWERLGVRVELTVVPAENIAEIKQAIKDRNYEVLVFGEILNLDPDQYTFWHSSQKKDPGLNLALYDNPNADKILEEARQALNPLERASRYDDFEKLLLEDAPGVFLYSPYYLYLPSRGIKGNELKLLTLPSARFDTASQWYMDTKRVKKEN